MTELMKDLDRVYTGLQNLKLQPTKHNTAILLDTFSVLESVYRFVEANALADESKDNEEAEEEEDNGRDDSTGERNAD